MSAVLLALLLGWWLTALGRATLPRESRTPWSRLRLREAATLAGVGLVWLSRTGEADSEV